MNAQDSAAAALNSFRSQHPIDQPGYKLSPQDTRLYLELSRNLANWQSRVKAFMPARKKRNGQPRPAGNTSSNRPAVDVDEVAPRPATRRPAAGQPSTAGNLEDDPGAELSSPEP